MDIIYYCDQETHIATDGITIFETCCISINVINICEEYHLFLYFLKKNLWALLRNQQHISQSSETMIIEARTSFWGQLYARSRDFGKRAVGTLHQYLVMIVSRDEENSDGFVIHVRWYVYSVRYSGRLTLIWIIEWCTVGAS